VAKSTLFARTLAYARYEAVTADRCILFSFDPALLMQITLSGGQGNERFSKNHINMQDELDALQTEAGNIVPAMAVILKFKMDWFTLRMRFSRIIWAIFRPGAPLKNPLEYLVKTKLFSTIIC